jgi:hypothetical protein
VYSLSRNFGEFMRHLFARLSTDPSSSTGPLCCYRNRSGFVLLHTNFSGSHTDGDLQPSRPELAEPTFEFHSRTPGKQHRLSTDGNCRGP